jgi:hypothetical protein
MTSRVQLDNLKARVGLFRLEVRTQSGTFRSSLFSFFNLLETLVYQIFVLFD